MVLDIDIEDYLHNLMATKPPYTCPYEQCGKTYKSYQGISYHLCNQHGGDGDRAATGDGGRKKGSRNRSPSGSDYGSATREALTYAEAQRMIEVEIDGRTHRININEPLNILKDDLSLKFNGVVKDGVSEDKSDTVSSTCPSETDPKHKSGKTDKAGKTDKSGKSGKTGSKLKKGKGKSTKTMAKVKAKSVSPEKPKLPEPSFRKLDHPIEVPDAEPRPASYYRFIEKSNEELDESVEYDMDEEDCVWLELVNKKRKQEKVPPIPPDTFELLMDRLEKESYFLSKDSNSAVTPAIDEDAVCCICNDGDCQNANAILFCDMCDLAVHQECYGVPYIPEGQWLCRRCLHSPSAGVDCALCPNKGGAFKQTDKGDWAHVVCAIWIPEVCFANTVFLEPIDSIENIPTARWRLNCYICKQRGIGACIQCHRPNCYVAFHVTCAQSAGLFMHIDVDKNCKNGVNSIRKAAYCHTHTPANETAGMQIALSGVYSTRDDVKTKKKKGSKVMVPDKTSVANESEFKEKIKKTRKILAEKRSALPQVSIPTIPLEKLVSIAERVTIQKRNQFIQRLVGYWTLKRQSRNGVPLLRRLQISYMGSRRGGELLDVDSDIVKKWKEEIKYIQRVRQDLERARLLIELIRKREKYKRQLIEVHEVIIQNHLQPFNNFLRQVLKQLSIKDTNKFFQFPVSTEEVTDYLDFIEHPMDLSTMTKKIDGFEYESFDSFEADFNLMINNCKSYNDQDTIYHLSAIKMSNVCRAIFRDGRERIQEIGFNEKAGVHDPPVSIQQRPLKLVSRISLDVSNVPSPSPGAFLSSTTVTKEQSLKNRLQELTSSLDKTQQLKSGGSRTARMRDLKDQMNKIRIQLHSLNPDRYPLPQDPDQTSSTNETPVSKKRRDKPSPIKVPFSPNKKPKLETQSKSPRTPKKSEGVSDSEVTDVYEFSSPTKTPVKSIKKPKKLSSEPSGELKSKKKTMKKKVTDVPNGSANNSDKKSKKKPSQSNDTKAKRPRLSSSSSTKKDGKKRKKSLDNAVEGDSVKKHVTGLNEEDSD